MVDNLVAVMVYKSAKMMVEMTALKKVDVMDSETAGYLVRA